MALAGLAAVTGFAGLAELLPKVAILWLLLVQAVAVAVAGVYLQSVVTPLSDPRDDAGRRLRPALPSGTSSQLRGPSCSHGYTVYAGKHPDGKPCTDGQ
ncbi:hypothetical protein CSH63_18005 [Micromonospora tulbaghiae]|uniref:Uncharacterized protein n=2 Tax=Micromonospora tulbaghiae TaxID=479978 RepID=A0A386WLN2_9ACTN|nr:hypothetical protein CSH63_18005 [Micromonospora tulbaghiae]